jgi:hypothetical protein
MWPTPFSCACNFELVRDATTGKDFEFALTILMLVTIVLAAFVCVWIEFVKNRR